MDVSGPHLEFTGIKKRRGHEILLVTAARDVVGLLQSEMRKSCRQCELTR